MLSIIANDVHIEFPVYGEHGRSLRHKLGLGYLAKGLNRFATRQLSLGGQIGASNSGRLVIKALDGVSFDIDEGDRIGIFGENGAGKSTLLRTIAGIYEPVRGKLETEGRVLTLFNLTLGMNQDATGLENIWLRGRMLGLTNQQIKDSVADIAEFTELGEYLHMPMRMYSTGMLLRLAFAISTATNPEILILDEIIGAGDAAFLAKADARLKGFLARTAIMVIASHSTSILQQWCNKGMLLERGQLVAYGRLEDVISLYEAKVQSR